MELAAAVGLGLSLFLAPYRNAREKINTRLNEVQSFYKAINVPDDHERINTLEDARDELDTADKALKPLLNFAVCFLVINALVAVAVLAASNFWSGILIPAGGYWGIFGWYFVSYSAVVLCVHIAATHRFKKVNELIKKSVAQRD